MKIIILIFPNLDPALVTNIRSLAERLEYEITGFVSFDQNETLTAIKNYPVYPMLDIYDLSWDVAIYADSDENFKSILPRLVKLQMGKDEQSLPVFVWGCYIKIQICKGNYVKLEQLDGSLPKK